MIQIYLYDFDPQRLFLLAAAKKLLDDVVVEQLLSIGGFDWLTPPRSGILLSLWDRFLLGHTLGHTLHPIVAHLVRGKPEVRRTKEAI